MQLMISRLFTCTEPILLAHFPVLQYYLIVQSVTQADGNNPDVKFAVGARITTGAVHKERSPHCKRTNNQRHQLVLDNLPGVAGHFNDPIVVPSTAYQTGEMTLAKGHCAMSAAIATKCGFDPFAYSNQQVWHRDFSHASSPHAFPYAHLPVCLPESRLLSPHRNWCLPSRSVDREGRPRSLCVLSAPVCR